MFRIDTVDAAASPEAVPAAGTEKYYIEGDPTGGVEATTVPAWWLNMVQDELRAIVVAAGLTPDKTDNAQVLAAINALIAAASTGIPAGQVSAFAMDAAPAGWLKCNGAAVSRTTYADLFAAIGTTFGVGDGSTTFALPDLRGEFVRGWDDGRGVDSARVFGSSQADEIKTHSHVLFGTNTSAGGAGSREPGPVSGTNTSTQATGGTETRPRNIALLFCIKY